MTEFDLNNIMSRMDERFVNVDEMLQNIAKGTKEIDDKLTDNQKIAENIYDKQLCNNNYIMNTLDELIGIKKPKGSKDIETNKINVNDFSAYKVDFFNIAEVLHEITMAEAIAGYLNINNQYDKGEAEVNNAKIKALQSIVVILNESLKDTES